MDARYPFATRYAGRTVLFGENDWQHPWLRIGLLLRAMLETQWAPEAWPQIRPQIPKALAEKSRIERMGFFN